MQIVEQGMKAAALGSRGWFANLAVRTATMDLFGAVAERVVEEARWRLHRAGRGSTHAAADLRAIRTALEDAAGRGDAYACEVLAAMCARGVGTSRSAEQAREWLIRAIGLLEGKVQRPMPGGSGFLLHPTDKARDAYRPLYSASGVLITNEIGTASMHDGAILFDRWGRPVLDESFKPCAGPTRASPRTVAARIARESTLEDFAWGCHRTTPEFRLALLDARVIAHGRMGFQRCRSRAARLAEAA
jgi:hypothetical protein